MNHRWIWAAGLLGTAFVTLAQTVYESKGTSGPVFSDRPSPGASSVVLPPVNVVSPPPAAAPTATTAASAAPPPRYRSLLVALPQEQGTVHSNTGAFDIEARLTPPLRADHRLAVSLDGQVLPTLYRSTRVHIGEADWRMSASEDAEHVVQLAVLDAQGNVLIESAPRRFFVRRATVGGRRR